MRKGLVRLAVAALAAAALLAGCTTGDDGGPVAGDEVPDAGYQAGDGTFTSWAEGERSAAVEADGTTFEGEAVDLADWRGDVVVLNFWYAACPPCRAEARDLAEISDDYAADGVRFLGVNGTDDTDTALAFQTTFDVPYPSLDDRDAAVVAALEGVVPLRAMPTTVVLDAEGRPAARVIGIADPTTLRLLIDDVLAEAA
ncbi:Redoxin domain protein [Beutenbergia cavernae DSM 12333]|uniref:Redoxin domain protein n=1 Tax=Beutenbergia cavernae (strain ATCC BAA-8 / DSM 12333 / CCUG 43141 / JCM 11478 / NBRC 16432 / NCIMB 13614 / HKI 0122) TaxID=471853 RepID=C5C187_BEUC1|nr:TlpA disulfide reductase family protein [Beutenbergia cavernae]ACQ81497.1 Redoxin domain protein [Beutenbergia cavernae DSM 12333]